MGRSALVAWLAPTSGRELLRTQVCKVLNKSNMKHLLPDLQLNLPFDPYVGSPFPLSSSDVLIEVHKAPSLDRGIVVFRSTFRQ